MTPSPTAQLKARALALGFDGVGVARVSPLQAQGHYEAWLSAGHHGDMHWLANEKHRQRRQHPELLVRDIRSVLCVALCYPPQRDDALIERLGRIARYAAGEDYHHIMKDKLYSLECWIRTELFPGSGSLWYSDTGAILERGWAERAGLGWIGKHSGLLSRTLGSGFLLGEVLMDRELEPDSPLPSEHCGTCTRCIEVCPTRAIVAPYQVDARRCISYLTIEHKGVIPRELRRAVGDWIFGCDLCQDACPWNRFAPPARESRLHARKLEGWTLERFLDLDESTFRTLFADSPIRRADREGFVRNVCVALGNRRQSSATAPLLRRLCEDEAPIVRGHAAWALGEIALDDALEAVSRQAIDIALAHCAGTDADAWVREEATRARTR